MSRLSFSLLVVVVLTTFLILSFGLSHHARMIPLVAAAIGLSLAVLQWFLDWRQRQQRDEGAMTSTGSAELNTVTWILSLPVLIWSLASAW